MVDDGIRRPVYQRMHEKEQPEPTPRVSVLLNPRSVFLYDFVQ